MPMTAGDRLGHYEILTPIGVGGMGEVWRATDTKLGRQVAIKILPESFAQDPDRMARFEREAQVLASLNHPNIAAIYGVEERAIVMELVEGKMLAGPTAVEEALPLIHQLVDALEYAHEKGVIHRDLKPANIKVTDEGRVKVLDFGLAKALSSDTTAADPTTSPTLTMRATMAGVIMGTAGYMAPEQARGHTVDKRADIWSFGVVVYEMLTGRQLFCAPTVSDTLASVLREEPDWDAVPPRLRRLVRACLVRDVRRRMRDAGDARLLIEESPAATAAPLPNARLPWTLAALAIMIAAVGMWGWLRPRPAESPMVMRFANPVGVSVVPLYRVAESIALSRDGSRIAFVGGPRAEIYVRTMDQLEAKVLAGTEGASFLSFSPDGRWISYLTGIRREPVGGYLNKVSVAGGSPYVLAPVTSFRNPPGQTWGDDGNITYVSDGVLYRIPERGGQVETIAKPDGANGGGDYSAPQWLPGGRELLVTIGGKTVAFNLRTHEKKTLLDHGWARYLPGQQGSSAGHLVYYAPGTRALMAVAFDLKKLEVRGAPGRVLDGVQGLSGPFGSFGLSDSGTLAYVPGVPGAGLRTMVWLDRQGSEQPIPAQVRAYRNPRLSPDGERIAVDISESADETQRADIWVYDLVRGTLSRITSQGRNSFPIWLPPEGKRLLFMSIDDEGKYTVVSAPSDGSSPPPAHSVSEPGPRRFLESVSFDGKLLMGRSVGSGIENAFWVAPLADAGQAVSSAFLDTRSRKSGAQFSPDGHWVAYASAETGSNQVYVTAFPGPGKTYPISTDGGTVVRWSRNGRELFYLNVGKMMAVEVQTSPDFHAGIPKALFEKGGLANVFDVSRDGKRFLMLNLEGGPPAQANQLNIVLNWSEELRRLAPASGK